MQSDLMPAQFFDPNPMDRVPDLTDQTNVTKYWNCTGLRTSLIKLLQASSKGSYGSMENTWEIYRELYREYQGKTTYTKQISVLYMLYFLDLPYIIPYRFPMYFLWVPMSPHLEPGATQLARSGTLPSFVSVALMAAHFVPWVTKSQNKF